MLLELFSECHSIGELFLVAHVRPVLYYLLLLFRGQGLYVMI